MGWYKVLKEKKLSTKTPISHKKNLWKLNNTFLNDQWVREEITKEIRKHFLKKEKKKYLRDE